MNSNTFINQVMKENQNSEAKVKQFTYGQIVAVGRKLHRLDNLLNNAQQFKEALEYELDDMEIAKLLSPVMETLLKRVAKYKVMYDNMLNTLN